LKERNNKENIERRPGMREKGASNAPNWLSEDVTYCSLAPLAPHPPLAAGLLFPPNLHHDFLRPISLSFLLVSMKALRKSLNTRDSTQPYISTPLPPVSRPSAAVTPPQKVIRATSSYRSPTPQQLSFQRGDFFYVIREVTEGGSWYEAHNPVTGARGLVPKLMFEAFNKGAAP
jgi:Variant SH3 domain